MSDEMSLTVPPAGWYPDRSEANLVRWWDGAQWTDNTQSTAPAAAAFEQPASAADFGWTAPAQNPVAQVAPAAQAYPAAQVASAPSQQISPGWYPDNANASLQRWWDGTQWTPHTSPAVAMSPQTVSSANNALGTLAMVLSIGSFAGLIFPFLLLLAIPGIIVGIVAVRRARQFAPGPGRRGQAIAGIVLGAVSIVLTVLLFAVAIVVYQQVHQTNLSNTGSQQSAPRTGGGTPTDNLTIDLSQAWRSQVASLRCDSMAPASQGSSFQCGVNLVDTRAGVVLTTMTPPGGYDVSVVQPPSDAGGSGSTDSSDPDVSHS